MGAGSAAAVLSPWRSLALDSQPSIAGVKKPCQALPTKIGACRHLENRPPSAVHQLTATSCPCPFPRPCQIAGSIAGVLCSYSQFSQQLNRVPIPRKDARGNWLYMQASAGRR